MNKPPDDDDDEDSEFAPLPRGVKPSSHLFASMGRPPDPGGPFDPARQASNLVITSNAAPNTSIGRPPDGGSIPTLKIITYNQYNQYGLRGSDQHRDHRYRHIKDMFEDFLFVDNFIEQGFPSDRLLRRHFVSGITPLKALEKSLGRESYIIENTVFERPKHFVRVIYKNLGGQTCYEYISSEPLPTHHCFWDKDTKEWRVSSLGLFYAAVQSDSHLDVDFTRNWFCRLGIDPYQDSLGLDDLAPKADDAQDSKWKRRKNKKKN